MKYMARCKKGGVFVYEPKRIIVSVLNVYSRLKNYDVAVCSRELDKKHKACTY